MSENEQTLAILQVIAQIPPGKVSTYGNIAQKAGLPGKARYVGYVLKHLPKDTSLPWFRVINASGRISFPPDSSAFLRQKEKLIDDGTPLINGRVNLREHLW